MIWNETIECMSREEMRKLQSIRLRRVVEHAYHNSPFYRKKMQEMGITPEDIHSIDDIVKLPFTVKQDLRDNYPFGLMAVPMSEIVRLHASSGTTGKPIVVGYTRKDLSIWAEVVARCLTAYGLTKNDSVQVSYGYGLFTGGLGAHAGVENIGGTVIPMSSGNTQKQIQLMHDFGAKGLFVLLLMRCIWQKRFTHPVFRWKNSNCVSVFSVLNPGRKTCVKSWKAS